MAAMATITLNIPSDAALARIVNALCDDAGWSAASGVTKAAFAKKVVADMVRDRVQAAETAKAQRDAVAAAPVPAPIDVT